MTAPLFREQGRSQQKIFVIVLGLLVLGSAWFLRASWAPQFFDTWVPGLFQLQMQLSRLKLPHWDQSPLEAEWTQVRAEKELLERRLKALELVADENQELRRLLKIPQPQSFKQVGAQVILRPPHQWFETLVIDQGFEQGLNVNQVVMGTEGVLGKISEVTAKTATVQLTSHPDSNVSCLVGKQKIPGVLIGQYRDQPAQLQYLQNYARIQSGDLVLTSGLGGIFPPNLVLGKVKEVKQIVSKPVPEASVILTPLENHISHVVVLVPEQGEEPVPVPSSKASASPSAQTSTEPSAP